MQNIIKITIIAVIVFPVVFMWNPQTATAPIQAIAQTEQTEIIPTSTLPWLLRNGSPENPTIPWCESRNQQFNADGTVKRGRKNPQDAGKYQINLDYHGARAIELGIDLYTENGNTKFALLLYKEQGTKPWNWSKSCWS